MGMEAQDERSGRYRQRERTRQFVEDAARDMLANDETVTVQTVAARTGISRATIYRYFPSTADLVIHAAAPAADDPLTDPSWPYAPKSVPEDLPGRAAALVRAAGEWAFDRENQLRALLRVSLEPDSAEQGLTRRTDRQRWIAGLLDGLPEEVPASARHRLAASLAGLFGSDAVVWTTDMARLERAEALDTLAWMAETLVRATLDAAD
ncbi:TetR/AcrR family transcriptional regulator [Streptomyces sp. NBC_00878]|uniref:TetR/AcrR family transcriptional regulator n=1 Tax=Streptomyces sp. NBC_00878 TaxID=2975854 RepID=UPI00225B7BBB|nr:TetR/AcrR family transcriptional regulator [Streptomyces sp. NBC_00878]MCX4909020.1 TetR/AcrR family transcriptional regulator [Streptomyces sp. NBC_00878]